MKTKSFFGNCLPAFFALGITWSARSQPVLKIREGTPVGLHTALTLHDVDLDNDGTLLSPAGGTGKVVFAGTANTTVRGTGSTDFNELELAKAPGQSLVLEQDLNIRTAIRFESGLLQLNGRVITLLGNASLRNESESSHITGEQGYIQLSTQLNAPQAVNPGNLGAVITSARNLGLTTVRRGHGETEVKTGETSVHRYFDILPADNTDLDATLRFSYLDTELNSNTESRLELWKSADGQTWAPSGAAGRDENSNWVQQAGLHSFSRWTLSDTETSMPVHFASFDVACYRGASEITWTTGMERNADYFEIQRSRNGRDWSPVGQIAAKGESGERQVYAFTDGAPDGSYYRVKEVDKDKSISYTTIRVANCATGTPWTAAPNPVQDLLTLSLATDAETELTLRLSDNRGRNLKKQVVTLTPGKNQINLDMHGLPGGTYLLSIMQQGNALQKTLKIVKK